MAAAFGVETGGDTRPVRPGEVAAVEERIGYIEVVDTASESVGHTALAEQLHIEEVVGLEGRKGIDLADKAGHADQGSGKVQHQAGVESISETSAA